MSKTTPRPMTAEEMRDIFIGHLRTFVEFWLACELGPGIQHNGETRYRMEGLVFSVLAMIDGANVGVPAFDIVPDPHAEDEAYHRKQGTNWWAADLVINDCQLHDLWHDSKPDPLAKVRDERAELAKLKDIVARLVAQSERLTELHQVVQRPILNELMTVVASINGPIPTVAIVASGTWNGAHRTLYWSELLPGFGGWSANLSQARTYKHQEDAETDLQEARKQMLNQALTVEITPVWIP